VAQWGAAQHADWVLLSRLNRIGPWVAEWEVQVVSTKERRAVSTRVVELKGLSRDTTLTAHLSKPRRRVAHRPGHAVRRARIGRHDGGGASLPCLRGDRSRRDRFGCAFTLYQ